MCRRVLHDSLPHQLTASANCVCHNTCLAGPRPYGDGAPYGRMFSERYSGLNDYAPPPMLRGGYSALADSSDRYRGSSSDSSSSSSSSTASRDEQQPPRRTRWGPA
jgi:hypothetical protein